MQHDGQYRRRAAKHLLRYLRLRPGPITVVYEEPYEPLVRELVAVANVGELLAIRVEALGPDELRSMLSSADNFLCAYNRTFRTGLTAQVRVMVECTVDFAERAATIVDVSHEVFDVFQADPEDIRAVNDRLVRVLQAGDELVVRDHRGTDLRVTLDPAYDFVNMDGFSEADFALPMNLPLGEVATYTPHVDGELVLVGGLLGTIPIGRKYGPIREPVRFTIARGRLVELQVDDLALRRDLEFCLFFDDYTSRVNEVGLGTNPAIRGPVRGYNYKHEENRLGFHLGFGASLAQQNVERLTPHHLDLLIEDTVLELDGSVLFNGDYRFEAFPAASGAAPLRLASRSCCMPSVACHNEP